MSARDVLTLAAEFHSADADFLKLCNVADAASANGVGIARAEAGLVRAEAKLAKVVDELSEARARDLDEMIAKARVWLAFRYGDERNTMDEDIRNSGRGMAFDGLALSVMRDLARLVN